jgi:hypothetical protein
VRKQTHWLRSFGRRTFYVVFAVVVILIAVRLALPYVVRDHANRILDQIGDYHGHVRDVSLSLWRGAYQIHDVKVQKMNGKIREPFFNAPTVDLSVQWSELFKGALVCKVTLQQPQINFVQGPSKEESQLWIDKVWMDKVRKLFPFKINSFVVNGGQIHYLDEHHEPPIDLYVKQANVVASNLTNSRKLSKTLAASVRGEGRTFGDAPVRLSLDLNPYSQKPTFKLSAELEKVDLVKLNNFLRAYAKLDVSKGEFSLYTEMDAKDGKFDGYVKPFFWHLEIAEWNSKKENVLELFWKSIVSGITTLLKNQPKDQLATEVPISGDLSNPDVDIWSTVGTLLKNAFVRALIPKLGSEAGVEVGENKKED